MKNVYIQDRDNPFSLKETLSCGQVFRWNENGGNWTGTACKRLIKITQEGRKLEYSGCDEVFLISYFHLDADLNKILDSVNKDEHINAAIERHKGLRLVRQDPWECLLSYICAQNAGIPFIQKMLENLSGMCGDPIENEAGITYGYPPPERLSSLCSSDIACCSTGYRSDYICKTAGAVASDKCWAERISELEYEEARSCLMKYKGIGRKVADCILLFGFQKYESFPVDRWMQRIMHTCYGTGDPEKPLTCGGYENIGRFGREYFGEYAGYAQEYLFADRHNG